MDDQDLLVLDEIRWETRGIAGNSGACNCQPGGDGPPCPHGNYDIQYRCRITEADMAKKILEDWPEREPIEVKEQPRIGFLILDVEEGKLEVGEMRFNDMTGEWEEV